MRRTLRSLGIAAFLSVSISAWAACPEEAPGSMAVTLTPATSVTPKSGPPCLLYACANGPFTLRVEPFGSGGFGSPAPDDPGYTVSPCDTVTWDFGDGTTQSVIGTDRVNHDYSSPGNYIIKATVTNSLGSETVSYGDSNGAVIATSPARLTFSSGTGKYPGGACDDCIVVREDNGPLTITVLRTLDLSRSISTEADVMENSTGKTIRTPFVFNPGETSKSFTIPIVNDQVFTGPWYWFALSFGKTTGGTLSRDSFSYPSALVIVEDDPPPTLSIEPTATVFEGDSGLTTVTVPYHLSAPMGVTCFVEARYDPYGVIVQFGSTNIEPGDVSGVAIAKFPANTLPEPDKSFHIRLVPAGRGADPQFGVAVSTVTILNDDAALYPAQTSAAPNAPVRLTLDVGSPYLTPVTAVITSTAPDVVSAPASVTIPAGATTVTFSVTPRAEGRAQISAVVPARTTQAATITVPSPRRRAAAH